MHVAPSCGGSASTLRVGVWRWPRSAEGLARANPHARQKEACHHMHHAHTETALHPCVLAGVTHTHRATARVASLAHKSRR